jgi:hypothetical protein
MALTAQQYHPLGAVASLLMIACGRPSCCRAPVYDARPPVIVGFRSEWSGGLE